MTEVQARTALLSLEGVEEGAHHGHPDFRVRNKIFGTLWPGKGRSVLRLPLEMTEGLAESLPTRHKVVSRSGKWGWLDVRWSEISEEEIQGAGGRGARPYLGSAASVQEVKRKLLFVLATIGGCILVVALGLWLASFSAESQVRRLLIQAHEAGLKTELPQPTPNPEAERIRRGLQEFKVASSKLPASPDLFTDDPHQMRAQLIEFQRFVSLAYGLSLSESYGWAEPSDLYLDLLSACELVNLHANYALHRGDFEGVISDAKAMRRLAHLTMSETMIGQLVFVLIGDFYFDLLQHASEQTEDSAVLREMSNTVDKWKRRDFGTAATYLLAEQLNNINEFAREEWRGTGWLDKMHHAWLRRSSSIAREKLITLQDSLDVCTRWGDDDHVLSRTNKAVDISALSQLGIYWYAGTLKWIELSFKAKLLALALTLHARTEILESGKWPSIEALKFKGLDVTDPVSRKPFRWVDYHGEPRILGGVRGERMSEIEYEVLIRAGGAKRRTERGR